MPDQQHWMRLAIQLSEQSVADGGGPFGAVIVRQGEMLGRGQNCVTSLNDPTAHAEIIAIREACKSVSSFSLAGCELYTSCEPCPMCLGAILWARLDRVWYANTRSDAAVIGFDDHRFYEEISRPPDRRTLSMTQLLRDEAQIAFERWVAADTRTPY